MRGIDIIATVFTDRGYRLLPFDMRRFDVQAQRHPGRRHDGNLMDQVLAQYHQRRHFCSRRRTRSRGISFTQRFAVVPHRRIEGLAHRAPCM